MIALYVILGIVFFIGVLLFCSVSFDISFEEKIFIKCHFLFLSFSVYPTKEKNIKKEKKSPKEENKNNKNNKIRDIIKKKGLNGFLQIVKKMLSIATGIIKSLFKHTCVDSLNLNIMVAEEDAAATAIKYGTVCSIVYPMLNILLKNSYKETYDVNIYPSFVENKSKVILKMKTHVKLIYILMCVIRAFFDFIKIYIKNFR